MIKLESFRPRLAEVGKIKIGGKGRVYTDGSGRERRLPDKFSYFVITTTERENPADLESPFREDSEIMTALAREGYADHDGRIRRLPISVFSDDLEEVYPTALVSYHGGLLYCRGDGEEATRHEIVRSAYTGKTKGVKCPCERLESKDCKYAGTLHCEIRLPGLAVAGAIYKWRNRSRISCEQMIGSLRAVLARAGSLVGMPLLLIIRPVRVAPKGTKPQTVYVCHVELREDILIAQRRALEFHRARAELAGEMAEARQSYMRTILELPGAESEEDQAEIGAEFHAAAEDAPLEAEVLEEEPLDAEDAAKLRRPAAKLTEEEPAAPAATPAPAPAAPPAPEAAPEPTPPARPAAPPPTDAKPALCGEDPKGYGKRSRCKKGGGLYYPKNLVDGLCPTCRGETAAPAAPPAPEATPEPTPPARELSKCEKCGRAAYVDEMQYGVCSFCMATPAAAPAAPPAPEATPEELSPEDKKALRDKFANQLMEDVKAKLYDPTKPLEEHRRRWPEIAESDHTGDYSLWTPEILAENLAILDRFAGRNQ